MSDVQAVMWMCAPLGTHSVHVWMSLVCVPMCEAHTPLQLHSTNVSVHGVHTMETLVRVCVSTSRATTASVHTVCVVDARHMCAHVSVCCKKRPHARCVVCVSHGSATHMLNKGTEMLHNAQWLTRSLMLAHRTALAMPTPPITKTRSPWTTADML